MSYVWDGDPCASRSLNLESAKVHSIDEGGLWFRGWDPNNMEVEVTVEGLTPEVLLAALREWGYLS